MLEDDGHLFTPVDFQSMIAGMSLEEIPDVQKVSPKSLFVQETKVVFASMFRYIQCPFDSKQRLYSYLRRGPALFAGGSIKLVVSDSSLLKKDLCLLSDASCVFENCFLDSLLRPVSSADADYRFVLNLLRQQVKENYYKVVALSFTHWFVNVLRTIGKYCVISSFVFALQCLHSIWIVLIIYIFEFFLYKCVFFAKIVSLILTCLIHL